uniref:Uncharacterized protein n=2 Tax=Opuntia streptacantha TaxID=393608 RepID=A0A7C8YHS4_OPUST
MAGVSHCILVTHVSLVLFFSLSSRMLCVVFKVPLDRFLCGRYDDSSSYYCYFVYLLHQALLIVVILAGLSSVFFGFYFHSGYPGCLPLLFPWVRFLYSLKSLLRGGWVIMSYPLVLCVAPFWSG